MPLWTWVLPVLALGALLIASTAGVGPWLAMLCGGALAGAVLVAVHHAEIVAHRLGEPFGTLVLALAVTAIEAALILSMMVAGGQDMAVLARDAIYAAVMIICTGVVGLCLLVGGLAHHEQTFRAEGAGAGLAALIVMAVLTLVLPAFTTSAPGGTPTGASRVPIARTSPPERTTVRPGSISPFATSRIEQLRRTTGPGTSAACTRPTSKSRRGATLCRGFMGCSRCRRARATAANLQSM